MSKKIEWMNCMCACACAHVCCPLSKEVTEQFSTIRSPLKIIFCVLNSVSTYCLIVSNAGIKWQTNNLVVLYFAKQKKMQQINRHKDKKMQWILCKMTFLGISNRHTGFESPFSHLKCVYKKNAAAFFPPC